MKCVCGYEGHGLEVRVLSGSHLSVSYQGVSLGLPVLEACAACGTVKLAGAPALAARGQAVLEDL